MAQAFAAHSLCRRRQRPRCPDKKSPHVQAGKPGLPDGGPMAAPEPINHNPRSQKCGDRNQTRWELEEAYGVIAGSSGFVPNRRRLGESRVGGKGPTEAEARLGRGRPGWHGAGTRDWSAPRHLAHRVPDSPGEKTTAWPLPSPLYSCLLESRWLGTQMPCARKIFLTMLGRFSHLTSATGLVI